MITIGRRDKIDIPELVLFDIEAKIDTGAFGCALHCHHIELVLHKGIEVLSFKVLDPTHPEYENKTFFIEQFSNKDVKSSSGKMENRYTIETEVVIFNEKMTVEFSLTDRVEMKFPILLGRKFLSKRFLVDVLKKDVSFKKKKIK
jgi:hypothetical protein